METQYIAFQFRAYPTPDQISILDQWLGSARFIWNNMLDLNQKTYDLENKFVFNFDMQKRLPSLKSEFPWLSNVPSQVLQQKCANLSTAFSMFLNPKLDFGFPNFKAKKEDSSGICFPQGWHIEGNRINLPKMKGLKVNFHREIYGKMTSLTLKKDKCGDFWISIKTSIPATKQITDIDPSRIVGIDMGLKNYAVLSDGTIIPNPTYLKNEKKSVARKSRSHSRKKNGSKNKEKARIKAAKKHRKIANQRKDFINKLVNQITNDYDLICTETLDIKAMLKTNKSLAKQISDAGWSLFFIKLAQKCLLKGKILIKIDQYFPSTKTCSCCGSVQPMPLNTRIYSCNNCGLEMDRDQNASINIRDWGIQNMAGTAKIYA